jgi:hypothetical protein
MPLQYRKYKKWPFKGETLKHGKKYIYCRNYPFGPLKAHLFQNMPVLFILCQGLFLQKGLKNR